MTLTYRNPAKMAVRRANALDALTSADEIMQGCGHAIQRRLDRTEPFGPPRFAAPTDALLDYYRRKRSALRASYFRQRYGRDYWTGRR